METERTERQERLRSKELALKSAMVAVEDAIDNSETTAERARLRTILAKLNSLLV